MSLLHYILHSPTKETMVVCVLKGAKHIVKRKDKIYPLILFPHLAPLTAGILKVVYITNMHDFLTCKFPTNTPIYRLFCNGSIS